LQIPVLRAWVSFFFSSRRRHTRFKCDWSSDVCSSDLPDAVRSGLQLTNAILWSRFLGPLLTASGPRRQEEAVLPIVINVYPHDRSEERRVGKECRSRWW